MIDYNEYAQFPSFVVDAMKSIEKNFSNPEIYERFRFNEVYMSDTHSTTYTGSKAGPAALIIFSAWQHTVPQTEEVKNTPNELEDEACRVYSFAYVTPETCFIAGTQYGINKLFSQHHSIAAGDYIRSIEADEHKIAYDKGYEDGHHRGYTEGWNAEWLSNNRDWRLEEEIRECAGNGDDY